MALFRNSSKNNLDHRIKSLTFFYTNAGSILPKKDELMGFASAIQPDLITVTETWLAKLILEYEVSITGYQLIHCDRNRHGSGVCLYVSESARILTADWHADAELLWVTLQLGRHKLLF